MGSFSFGPPIDFVRFIKDKFGIETFIEGGTYQGETARWAAQNFRKAISIELSKELHQAAKERLKDFKNLELLQGHTKDALKSIVGKLDKPAIFWLDAHWSGGITAGEEEECPILEEIEIINRSKYDHVVMIDDARLFTAPPPAPHKIEHWPDIWQIERALQKSVAPRRVLITQDVIIGVTDRHGDEISKFWHHWKAPQPNLPARAKQSIRLILNR